MANTNTTETVSEASLTLQILAVRDMLVAAQWASKDAVDAFKASNDDAEYDALFTAMDDSFKASKLLRDYLEAFETEYLAVNGECCPVNPGY